MKKLTTLLLTFALVFTMSVPAFAVEPTEPTEAQLQLDKEYICPDTDDIGQGLYYTPSADGGYKFELTNRDTEITNHNLKIAVENTSLNKNEGTAAIEGTATSCTLRVYLKGNTKYKVSVSSNEAVTGVKYKLKASNLDASETYNRAASIGTTAQPFTLYSFSNRTAQTWLKYTAPKDDFFEFVISPSAQYAEGTDETDINVVIRESDFYTEDEDGTDLISGEGGTIIKQMHTGEECYIVIREPNKGDIKDTYQREILVKEHEHNPDKVSVDGNCITVGCPCEEPNYQIWLEKVSFKNAVYGGGTPAVKFTYEDWESKDGVKPSIPTTAYEVTINKTDVGPAKATIKFFGDYADLQSYTVDKNFKIVPATTTLKSVKPAKKALTVKWDKQSSKIATGYQIQYSTSSKFKSAKTVTITKNKTTSKKISKLKAKKNYYVKVRTYKTVKKTKYYSAWSDAVKVKTK